MASEPVSYQLKDGVATITFDDGKANALSMVALRGLIDAVTRAEAEANAIVVVGRPERFSAGFDLKVMMSSPQAAVELLTVGCDLLLKLYGCPLPLVIACTGHAIAGGALFVLTGDLRIGVHGAFKIGLNEVAIGLPVPMLAMEFARARLTSHELANATLAARLYDPEGARAAGFLDEVVPASELLPRATAEAARLGALSRMAYQKTKVRLRGQTIRYIRDNLADDMRTLLTP